MREIKDGEEEGEGNTVSQRLVPSSGMLRTGGDVTPGGTMKVATLERDANRDEREEGILALAVPGIETSQGTSMGCEAGKQVPEQAGFREGATVPSTERAAECVVALGAAARIGAAAVAVAAGVAAAGGVGKGAGTRAEAGAGTGAAGAASTGETGRVRVVEESAAEASAAAAEAAAAAAAVVTAGGVRAGQSRGKPPRERTPPPVDVIPLGRTAVAAATAAHKPARPRVRQRSHSPEPEKFLSNAQPAATGVKQRTAGVEQREGGHGQGTPRAGKQVQDEAASSMQGKTGAGNMAGTAGQQQGRVEGREAGAVAGVKRGRGGETLSNPGDAATGGPALNHALKQNARPAKAREEATPVARVALQAEVSAKNSEAHGRPQSQSGSAVRRTNSGDRHSAPSSTAPIKATSTAFPRSAGGKQTSEMTTRPQASAPGSFPPHASPPQPAHGRQPANRQRPLATSALPAAPVAAVGPAIRPAAVPPSHSAPPQIPPESTAHMAGIMQVRPPPVQPPQAPDNASYDVDSDFAPLDERLLNRPPMDDFDEFLRDLTEEERRQVVEERRRRMREVEAMIRKGKLCLVLDLDHTLLNSAKASVTCIDCS